MRGVDLLVVAAFLAFIVWDGMRRGREAKDPVGYILAGRRMRWWAMGLSVMATQASAITLLSTTGQGFEKGMRFLHLYLAIPFAMVILAVTVVPWFHRANVLTAYEHLERRFDRPTRLLAAVIFLISRALAVGTVLYAPSIVLSRGVGIPYWQSILLMGVLSTAYTAVGGNAAVIATDAKQMIVMMLGVVICVATAWNALPRDIGFGDALRVAGATGRLDTFHVTTDWKSLLAEKYNIFSSLLGGLFLFLGYFGADQEQVQRYLAGSSVTQSRKSLFVSAFAKVPMQFVILLLGVLLYVGYAFGDSPAIFRAPELERALSGRDDPEAGALREQFDQLSARYDESSAARASAAREFLDVVAAGGEDGAIRDRAERLRSADAAIAGLRTEGMSLLAQAEGSPRPDTNDADYVFTHFLVTEVPIGLAGLVLSAIFAAAISSLVAPLNSLATSAVIDLWLPLRRTAVSPKSIVRATRLATIFWGAFATVAAFWMGGDPIIEKVNRIGSVVYGSMFGVFILGRVVPRARGAAGWISLASGVGSVLLIENVLNGKTLHLGGEPWTIRIEFLWYNLIGFVVVMLVGTLASFLIKSRAPVPPQAA